MCEEKGVQISDKIGTTSLFAFEEHTNKLLNYLIDLHNGKIKLQTEKKVIEKFRNILYNMLLVIDDTSKFIELFVDKLFKYFNDCDTSRLKKPLAIHLRNIAV